MTKKQSSTKKSAKVSKPKEQPTKSATNSSFREKLQHFFFQGKLGKLILFFLTVLILFLLNVFLSRDDFTIFTLLCGIEILFTILVASLYLLHKRRDDFSDK